MGFINLTKVDFPVMPATTQLVTVKYRVATQEDVLENYKTAGTNVPVLPTGNFQSSPFKIDGLIDKIQYVVWVYSPCGGGGVKVTIATA